MVESARTLAWSGLRDFTQASGPMSNEEYLARANIERFQRLLQTCCDEVQRRTLEQLLAEQQQRLAHLTRFEGAIQSRGGLTPTGLPLNRTEPIPWSLGW